MKGSLNEYQHASANWRKTLRTNALKTKLVILTYFLIYIFLGLLIDTYIYAGHFPQNSIAQIFHAIVTFQLMPKVTFVTFAIAFISLIVVFAYHDKLMLSGTEYREITPTTAKTPQEVELYHVVEEMKIASALSYMPKVYLIEADYMNAFASGYSEKSAMVAITRGLMEKLDRAELQAVMAHEMSHIRHLDIRLTLIASVLSNLLLIIVDILFFNAIFGSSRRSSGSNQLLLIIVLLRYLLPLVTVLLMLYLSRSREYMADAGAVELTRNNEPLANALLKIRGDHKDNKEQYAKMYRNTKHEGVRREAYIFDPIQAGVEPVASLSDMFSTHPSIQKRLKALGFIQKS